MSNKYFECLICGKRFDSQPSAEGLCPSCGGTIVIHYDYDNLMNIISKEAFISRRGSMWRYVELLPIPIEYSVSIDEGWTPIHKTMRLGEVFIRNLLIKNETLNPTGSFLDRGASVVVGYAKMNRFNSIYTDTLGNLAASLAAYAARAGIKCIVQVKEVFDQTKIYQILSYGAELKLSNTLNIHKSYYIGPANPYVLEGVKTIAFEIAEQLSWRAPDWIVIPAGNGGLLVSLWKGFWELKRLGLVNSMPKFAIAQLSSCNPIVRAIKDEKISKCTSTIAKDIAISKPLHLRAAMKILKDGGLATSVTEEEIINSMKLLARYEGILAEPAAATALAGLKKLVEDGIIDQGDEVVLVITGSGLKDPSIIVKSFSEYNITGLFSTKSTRLGRTKLLILKLLASAPHHGYELMKLLQIELGSKITTTTVYQHLKELENMGLIELVGVSRIGGKYRKLYKLTRRGELLLKALSKE